MPAAYEHMRDSMVNRGVPLKEAEKIAAEHYNAHRAPGAVPMGPNYEQRAAASHGAHRNKK